jgi:hypothetical protein
VLPVQKSGRTELYPPAPHLESLAQHYAGLLRHHELSLAAVVAGESHWETVDLVSLPRGCKSYGKIVARLGRLREHYPTIAQFYDIKVEHRDGQLSCLTWEVAQPEQLQNRFSGAYYLRSNRQDLDDAEIWSLYILMFFQKVSILLIVPASGSSITHPAVECALGQFRTEDIKKQHEPDHQEKLRGKRLKIEEGAQRRIGK